MSKRTKLLAVIILALMSVGGRASNAQTPRNSSGDEAAIRKLVQQVQDGWNAHDGKAFAAPFAPDADYVVVNGMRVQGREAIEKGHTELFTGIYKNSRNVATINRIRFLRPDVGVVHNECNLLHHLSDSETRKGHAMNTMVMTKENGKWSIAAFHNTPIRAEGR